MKIAPRREPGATRDTAANVEKPAGFIGGRHAFAGKCRPPMNPAGFSILATAWRVAPGLRAGAILTLEIRIQMIERLLQRIALRVHFRECVAIHDADARVVALA